MIGEMNASHMGISGPAAGTRDQRATGRIGLDFDRAAYEQRGELRVTEIIPLAPAALSEPIKIGDRLLAVDGTPIGRGGQPRFRCWPTRSASASRHGRATLRRRQARRRASRR